MTGILDRIRATTPETLAGVRSDFDDAPTPIYRPKQPKNMIRTVEGADDLKVTRPAPVAPGMSKAQDWSDAPATREARCLECDGFHAFGASCGPKTFAHDGEYCDDRRCCPEASKDMRSEGQVRYMDNLISWITEKDQATGDAARTWTDNVTAAGKWSWDKADKFSISGWIDRLKAKNAELNSISRVEIHDGPDTYPTINDELPTRKDKSGKHIHLYYAVEIEGTLKFYRIKQGRKAGFFFIDVQASDEFHPIRNGVTKRAIVKAIVEAGPENCMALYGQHIGACGRCGRTLTDAESRARGIGPDCWEKM